MKNDEPSPTPIQIFNEIIHKSNIIETPKFRYVKDVSGKSTL